MLNKSTPLPLPACLPAHSTFLRSTHLRTNPPAPMERKTTTTSTLAYLVSPSSRPFIPLLTPPTMVGKLAPADATRSKRQETPAPRTKPRSPRHVHLAADNERSQRSGTNYSNFAFPEHRRSARTDNPIKGTILPTVGNRHYVFVYGTLKKGFANSHLLDRATFIGEFRTIIPFPLVVGGKYNSPYLLDLPMKGTRVKGEVYAVDDAILADLDHLENVGVNYSRKVAKVSNCADRSMVADVFIYFKSNGFESLMHKAYTDDYQCRRYVPRHMRPKKEMAAAASASGKIQ